MRKAPALIGTLPACPEHPELPEGAMEEVLEVLGVPLFLLEVPGVPGRSVESRMKREHFRVLPGTSRT